ncbi:MAG: hypothetical protein MRZ42_04095 [Tenericutes bacterium]|nr:hypothetical protein [Mycoplasmatota bacterium]
MKDSYVFEYLNENDFRVKERSVRKYNMLAYKKMTFEYYPKLKTGEFLGKMVGTNTDGSIMYELPLPTDEMFSKVHGVITLHYTVYQDKKVVLLTNITPEGILEEGHRTELGAYKGVMVSKTNKEKDIFKINLLNMMNKGYGNVFALTCIVASLVLLMIGIIGYFVFIR